MGEYSSTTRIINNILKLVIISGMAGCIIVAPNALILGDKALRLLDKREQKMKLRNTLGYMQRKSLISYREMPDGNFEIKVSVKGRKRMSRVEFDELQIEQQKKWDKKWRIVMFDIPEQYRKSRSALSRKLRLMGFYQLQKSAWVHPYPCRKEVEIIRQVFSISSDEIVMAEVLAIDKSDMLKKRFRL